MIKKLFKKQIKKLYKKYCKDEIDLLSPFVPNNYTVESPDIIGIESSVTVMNETLDKFGHECEDYIVHEGINKICDYIIKNNLYVMQTSDNLIDCYKTFKFRIKIIKGWN
jgi:hypothetical protein